MRRTTGKQIAWLIALCVALWGPMANLPMAANCLRLSAPARIVVPSDHAPDCRCSACPGGKRCCCRPTENAALAFRLMARCDRSQPVSFTAKINPPLPPHLAAIPFVWIPASAPRIAAKDLFLRPFSLAPSVRPPNSV